MRAFPQVRVISYSTCSRYSEENEFVVMDVLSEINREGTLWKLRKEPLSWWSRRGSIQTYDQESKAVYSEGKQEEGQDHEHELLTSCVRCSPSDGDDCGIGFFLCVFEKV